MLLYFPSITQRLAEHTSKYHLENISPEVNTELEVDAYSKCNSPLPIWLVLEDTILGSDSLTMPKNGANLGASSASAIVACGPAWKDQRRITKSPGQLFLSSS